MSKLEQIGVISEAVRDDRIKAQEDLWQEGYHWLKHHNFTGNWYQMNEKRMNLRPDYKHYLIYPATQQ